MSRLRRWFLSDVYFFVTVRLHKSRSLLDSREFTSLANSMGAARREQMFLVTAWVFLPDHWHGILYPRHPVTISSGLKSIKLRSTAKINDQRQESGELWQGRFFDRILRTVGEYHKCVEYLHFNPVRRGLVERPEEWPWSSIHSYLGTQDTLLSIDRVNLPADPNYRLLPP